MNASNTPTNTPINLPTAYRAGVGIMLLDSQGRVLVGKRIDMVSESWQMPQGGIDEGEAPRPAAFRELEEETGVVSAEIIAESPDWLTYDLPDELVPRVLGGKFRGQKQKWFAMRFTGDEQEINIHTEEPEFSEYRWVSHHDIVDMIVPFKRDMYERVIALFSEHLPD